MNANGRESTTDFQTLEKEFSPQGTRHREYLPIKDETEVLCG
jgi:hypothetical protein